MAEEMAARLGQREVLLGGLPEALEGTRNRAKLTGVRADNRSVDRGRAAIAACSYGCVVCGVVAFGTSDPQHRLRMADDNSVARR